MSDMAALVTNDGAPGVRNPAFPIQRSVVSCDEAKASFPKGRVAGGRAWYFFSTFGAPGDCAKMLIVMATTTTVAVNHRVAMARVAGA